MSADRLCLGIVGAGCIGRTAARALAVPGSIAPYRLVGVSDSSREAATLLAEEFQPDCRVMSVDELIGSADVVLESAAAGVVSQLVDMSEAVAAKSGAPLHLVVMSVGGLAGVNLEPGSGLTVHVPSGAIGGLDAVRSMKEAGLDSVMLTSTKPPAGLGMSNTEVEVLFEGPAAEVVKLYPKNTNVAMALAFAGVGPLQTRVRLVSDPDAGANTHHIVASGAAGRIEFKSSNVPFPDNPRTSFLAALSAISVLRGITQNLQVG